MNVILLDWLTLQRGPAEGEEHHEQINERYTSLGSWCSLWSRGRQKPGDDTHTNGATNTCEKHELCTYGVSVIMRIHQCWDTYLSSSNAINDRSTGQSTNETRYTGGKASISDSLDDEPLRSVTYLFTKLSVKILSCDLIPACANRIVKKSVR
jgi:hypothetical protein